MKLQMISAFRFFSKSDCNVTVSYLSMGTSTLAAAYVGTFGGAALAGFPAVRGGLLLLEDVVAPEPAVTHAHDIEI